MHKPGRLLPAANAALLLLYGIGRSLGPRSDRPGPAVRVIEMRKAIASSHGSAAIAPPREGSGRCEVADDRFDRHAGVNARDRIGDRAQLRVDVVLATAEQAGTRHWLGIEGCLFVSRRSWADPRKAARMLPSSRQACPR